MRLATKFILLLVAGIVILLAVDGYLAAHRDMQFLKDDARQDALQFSDRLETLIAKHWQHGGDEEVDQFLQQLNEQGAGLDGQSEIREFSRVRWVMLDAGQDDKHRPLVTGEKLQLVITGKSDSVEHQDRGKDYVLTYNRVSTGDTRPAALEVLEPVQYSSARMRLFVYRLLILTATTVLLGVAIIILLGRELVGRPLRMLLEKTRRIGHGDLSEPVQLKRNDEFGELAAAINAMCDELSQARETAEQETATRISAMEHLRHADRLRTIGRLAAGIAHEIGTPLNVIGGRAEILADESLPESERKKSARVIKAESERITAIVRQLLDFARRGTSHRAAVEMTGLVQQVLAVLQPLAEKQDINFRVVDEAGPTVCQADAGQIQQVLTNLIVNAGQAMPDGGTVEIGLRRQRAEPPDRAPETGRGAGRYLSISVNDQGQGIAEEHLSQIFEPFFTTKDVGEGTGLGLSIAYGIAEEHGGWIDVHSQLGQGSTFTLYLPLEKRE